MLIVTLLFIVYVIATYPRQPLPDSPVQRDELGRRHLYWTYWFAWYPVQLGKEQGKDPDGGWTWLRWVERYRKWSCGYMCDETRDFRHRRVGHP